MARLSSGWTRGIATLGGVVALTAGVAACSTVNPFSISKAYADTVSAHSAKFDMTMDVTTPGAAGSSQSMHMSASGAMDMTHGLAEMTMRLPSIGGMGMRFVGSTIYIQLPPQLVSKVPGGKSWISMNLPQFCGTSGASLFGGGTADPSSGLGQLRGATGAGLQNLGSVTIDGVETTHYRANIDMSKAAQAVKARCPGGLMGQAMQKQAGHIHMLPADVWVDSQDHVRRVTTSMTAPIQSHTMRMTMTMDLSDFGVPVQVSAPPASDVLDASQLPGFQQGVQAGAGT